MLLTLFVGLVVGIRFVNQDIVLIFPEGREVLEQKRADKDNNAHYTLIESIELLPPHPTPIPIDDPEVPGVQIYFSPKSGSLGDLTNIMRPSDHPDLMQFLRDSKPALDHAVTMLEKKYYLFEYPIIFPRHDIRFPDVINPDHFMGTWIAYGMAQFLYWDESDDGVETFDTIFKVLKLQSTEAYVWFRTFLFHEKGHCSRS